MHWYVFVENQSYGPYSDDQMRGFVAEGRISNSSLISNTPQSGFFSATEFDAYNLWSGEAQQNMLSSVAAAGAVSVQATTANYAPIQPIHEQPIHEQPIQKQPIQKQYEKFQQVAQAQEPQSTPAVHSNKSCVFLVMAEIRSSGEMAFLQTLRSFGQTQRVGDTVWLVRSTYSVEQIRNTLSQTLDQQDRLFILNSHAGKTAWFNIGADLDHRIRELWDEDEG